MPTVVNIKRNQSPHNILKIASAAVILSLISLSSYLLLKTPGANVYEVSIYEAYPSVLWITFILIDVFTLFWVLLNGSKHIHNALLVTLLFLNQLTVLLLPLFRGYFIYGRADVLEHLGQVRDILYTGHIGSDNFYPIMHILISDLNLIGGATLNRLTILLPAFFWIMLLMWYYLFTKYSLNQNIAKISILGWMLFPLGYWHTSMVGNIFSYILMFLIIGVWFSTISRTKKYILVFIMYMNLVYFHPLTSIYLLIILTFVDILNKISDNQNSYVQRFLPNMAILVLVAWFMWYMSFPSIQFSFAMFWESITNPRENPFLSQYLLNVNRYHLSIYTLLKFSIYRYFGVGIFSLIALILIWKRFKRTHNAKVSTQDIPHTSFLLFTSLFLIFTVWSFVNLFLHFVNFERSLRYILAFSLPLGSAVLFGNIPTKRISKIFLSSMLIIMIYFSIFTVHMSPLSGNLNMQVSASEYFGTGWLFYNRNPNIIAYDDGQITQYRFYEAWYGRDKVLKAKNILFYGRGYSMIPEHFGYDEYSTTGELFSTPRYFIIGRAVWEFYKATIPDRVRYWRWRPEEYKRLKTDPTVDSVYSSTDINIYWIVPKD